MSKPVVKQPEVESLSEPAWKKEMLDKRRKREMETDVEQRWRNVMESNGEGAPEWLKEAAMRRKASLQKEDEISDLAPWMKEVKKKNAALARRMSEATVHERQDEA